MKDSLMAEYFELMPFGLKRSLFIAEMIKQNDLNDDRFTFKSIRQKTENGSFIY